MEWWNKKIELLWYNDVQKNLVQERWHIPPKEYSANIKNMESGSMKVLGLFLGWLDN